MNVDNLVNPHPGPSLTACVELSDVSPAVLEVPIPSTKVGLFLLLQVQTSAPPKNWIQTLDVKVAGSSCELYKPDLLSCCVLAVPHVEGSPSPLSSITVSLQLRPPQQVGEKSDKVEFLVSIAPATGMFSVKWASRSRIVQAKKMGKKPPWAPEDFPFSHFDGLRYLKENPEVLAEVIEGRVESALAHYLSTKGTKSDLPPLSLNGSPCPGNLKNLLEDGQRTAVSLRDKVAKLEARIDSFRRANGENATKRKAAEGKLAKALERIESFRKSNGENAAKAKALEAQLSKAAARIDSFRKENGKHFNGLRRALRREEIALSRIKTLESRLAPSSARSPTSFQGSMVPPRTEHFLALNALATYGYILSPSDRRPVHIVTHIPFWRKLLGNHKRIFSLASAFDPTQVGIIYVGKLTLADATAFAFECRDMQLHSTLTLANYDLVNKCPSLTSPSSLDLMSQSYNQFLATHPPDLLICEYISIASMLTCVPHTVTTLLDTHDVMWQRQQSYNNHGRAHHIDISRDEEAAIYARFDGVIAIQNKDATLIREMAPHIDVLTCYEPVIGPNLFKHRKPRRLGYIAGNNPANIDSIQWFLDAVWPRISPTGIELHIYGAICSSLKHLTSFSKNLFLHGHVDRPQTVYSSSDIIVNPVLYGGGLKIKTIEALAHGLPLITTSCGAEGLEDLANIAYLVEDGVDAFVTALKQLINDPALRLRLSQSCELTAKVQYSSDECQKDLRLFLRARTPHIQLRKPVAEKAPKDDTTSIQERLLIIAPKNFALTTGLNQYFIQYSDTTTKDAIELVKFGIMRYLKTHCIDRVFFFNPYINDVNINVYSYLRTVGFPFVCFDRGALPDSWFFDSCGFNTDSLSYDRSRWFRQLTPDESLFVRRYINTLTLGTHTLEQNGHPTGVRAIREKYNLTGKTVIFVPFQRPNDTVVKFFARSCGGYEGFLSLVAQLRQQLPANEYVMLAKKHPLEVTADCPNITFVDETENIHDLIEAADFVITINSGVGVLSLCHGKVTICCGESFYSGPDLAYHCYSLQMLLDCLSKPHPKGVTPAAEAFIYYLINNFYSFGKSRDFVRRNNDGSLDRVTTAINFCRLGN